MEEEKEYEYNIIVKYQATGNITIKGKNKKEVKERFERIKSMINQNMITNINIDKIEEQNIEPTELYEPEVISFCKKIGYDINAGIEIIHIITNEIKKGKITGIKENNIKQYEEQLNKKFMIYSSWEKFKNTNELTEKQAKKYLNDKVFVIEDYMILAINEE